MVQQQGVSERRSCALIAIGRSSFRYVPHPRDDRKLAERLRRLSQHNKRYGYRQAGATLRREGQRINHKRVYRVWKQEGLSRPKRTRKKRGKPTGTMPCEATHPGHVWTYDFIHDACWDGRKLKILTVLDEFTRECMAIEAQRSLRSEKVQAVLQRLFAQHGVPKYLRSDNGPEFIAGKLRQWLAQGGPETIYIDPGSPWQNAYGESFHGSLRDECLNMEVFGNLAEAKVIVERWRRDYNQQRPHSSLGYLTPAEFKAARRADNGDDSRPGLSLWGPPEGQGKGQSETPCPSVRSPVRRSGCSPAEPYPPGRQKSVYHQTGEPDNSPPRRLAAKQGS